ncbi:MAG: hypothetical protein ACM3KR_09095 [Deltaproteobacteria bacterium]
MGFKMCIPEKVDCPDELRHILEDVKINGGVFVADRAKEEEYINILKVLRRNDLDELFAFEEEYNDFMKTLKFSYILSMIVQIVAERLESEEGRQLFVSIPELENPSILASILVSRMNDIVLNSLDIYQYVNNTVTQAEKTKYNILRFNIRTHLNKLWKYFFS